MSMSNSIRRANVTIMQNKGERKVELANCRSVMEVSDEENETMKGVAFCVPDHKGTFKWLDFNFDDVDEIRIKPMRK